MGPIRILIVLALLVVGLAAMPDASAKKAHPAPAGQHAGPSRAPGTNQPQAIGAPPPTPTQATAPARAAPPVASLSAPSTQPASAPPQPAPTLPRGTAYDVPVITFLTVASYAPGVAVDVPPVAESSLAAAPAPTSLAWLRWVAPLVGLVGIGAVLSRARLVAPPAPLPPSSKRSQLVFASADDPVALLTAAKQAVAQNRLDEAVLWFDHALRIAPDLAVAHFCRGICLVGLDRQEDAYAALRRAFEIDPSEGAHRLELARACARTGRAAEAMRVISPLLVAAPELIVQVREDPAFQALGDHPTWLAMTGAL